MPHKSSTMDVVAVDSPAHRRGPKPLLSTELETQLVQWILTQQNAGRRVSRDAVITQAKKLLRKDETQDHDQYQDDTKQSLALGMGWCNRFMARHPGLSLRSGGLSIVKKKVPATSDEILKFTSNDGVLPIAAVNDQEAETLKVSDTVKQSETMENQGGEASQAVGPTKTRKYNMKHMEAAVEMYLAGRSMSEVSQRFPLLHQRTVRRRVLRVQRGEVDRRRGPRPLLEGEPEQELVAWILDMQSRCTKVTKKDILTRANEQYRVLTGGEAGENRLKEGWLRRFKERHPVLSGRAPARTHQEEEEGSSTEEGIYSFSSGGGELSNSTQSTDGQQDLVPSFEAKEKCGSKLESLDATVSVTEDTVAAPKRQKIEEKISIPMASHSSGSIRQGFILPERRQSGKVKNVQKLDAILQSNERLEEMQRQQLDMLQQLCASNKVLLSFAGSKRNFGSTTTE